VLLGIFGAVLGIFMVLLVHLDRFAFPPANNWISTLIKNSEIHFSKYTLRQSTKPPRQSLHAQLLHPISQWQAFLHVGRKFKTLLSNTHTHVCVCLCMSVHGNASVCMHTHVCTHKQTCNMCVCVHMCLCTHAHTHMHMDMCVCVCPKLMFVFT